MGFKLVKIRGFLFFLYTVFFINQSLFFIFRFLVQFKKFYSKRRIYLISQKTNDKLLDPLIHKRIPINEIGDANFDPEDFKECLVIFDDIDVISDKKEEKAVFDLISKLLEIGRSLDIYVILILYICIMFDLIVIIVVNFPIVIPLVP